MVDNKHIIYHGRHALPHLSIVHGVQSLLELFRHDNLPLDGLLELREDEADLRDNFLQTLDLLNYFQVPKRFKAYVGSFEHG